MFAFCAVRGIWVPAFRWFVDFLVSLPLSDLNELRPTSRVPDDAILGYELIDPAIYALQHVVVVWEQLAAEESRTATQPPLVVGDSPHKDEQQPRVPAEPPH